ncbi:MAG: cytochrome c [Actinomycetota bacterium]
MRTRKIGVLTALALVATLIAGCGGDDTVEVATSSGPQSRGEQLATESCSSCHGQNFEGVDKLGPALRDNAYIQDHTDEELVAFIKEGRLREAEDNTSGIAMPAYGGNTRLTDEDLAEIVSFLRTLQ